MGEGIMLTKVKELAKARKEREEIIEKKNAAQARLEVTPTWKKVDDLARQKKEIDGRIAEIEDSVRQEGLIIYESEQATKFFGCEIKIFTVSEITDPARAVKYLTDHDLLSFLTLADEDKFIKLAELLELPFIEVKKVTKVFIPRRLDEFLED